MKVYKLLSKVQNELGKKRSSFVKVEEVEKAGTLLQSGKKVEAWNGDLFESNRLSQNLSS